MKTKLARMRLLLVEDHAPTATMLEAMLHALGVGRVTTVANTTEAMNALKDSGYDFLLCDIRLGIVDGLTLVRMIRRPDGLGNPNIPIVMITAHAEPERVAEALAAGVNDFLVKPVQPDKLMLCMEHVLMRPREFIKSRDYAGPDRRRKQTDEHPGRRRADNEGRPIPKNKWIVPPKS